jgi:hypothetical protein
MSQTTVSLQPDDPGWRRAQGQLLTADDPFLGVVTPGHA